MYSIIKKILFILIFSSLFYLLFSEKNIFEFNNVKNYQKKISEKTSLINLDNIIDLENQHNNFFYASNIILLNRFYYKINEKDLEYLIINVKDLNTVKKYFISKKLNKLDDITNINNEIKKYNYIPEKENGLYFCLQKVKYDNSNFKEYFQIFNINAKKILYIDFENSILFNFLENTSAKLNIYLSNGKITDSQKTDNSGFLKIKNNSYNELYVYNKLNNSLFKAKLNAIKKVNYAVFAVYENPNDTLIKLNGVLTNYGGDTIKDFSKIDFSLKISGFDKIPFYSKKIDNINNSGFFNLEINKSSFFNQEMFLSFYVNNILIKEYVIDLNYENIPAINNKNINILENVIFNNNPACFILNKNLIDKIDFVNCMITNKNKTYQCAVKKISPDRFEVLLPENTGDYQVSIELIFKNGDFFKNTFNIKKINFDSDANNNLKIIIDNYNGFLNNEIEFNNPFDNADCFQAVYNKDIIYYNKINLTKGKNTVKYDNNFLYSDNNKSLLYIYDPDNNNNIIILNDLLNNDLLKNINADILNKNDTFNITINQNDNFKNKNIFIQFIPENESLDKLILNTFYNYNCFNNPEIKKERIYIGRNFIIDQNNSINIDNLNLKGNSFNVCLLLNENGNIYKYEKNIYKKNIIDIKFIGPDKFSYNDNPEFIVELVNNYNKNLIVDLDINILNGIIVKDNSIITLDAFQKKIIPFFIKDFKPEKPIDLTLKVYNTKINYANMGKRLRVVKELKNNFVEMNGKIISNKKSTSYISLPGSTSDDYKLELFVSNNKYINLLKKNSIVNDFKLDILEIELNNYLEEYIENLFLKMETKKDFINKYYIFNKGFKNNPNDQNIDIDTTLLILFANNFVDLLSDNIGVNEIIFNLVINNKNDILKSDFRIFILSESGIFFDEITTQFLNNIGNTDRALFYYNYFKKNKIQFKDQLKITSNQFKFRNYNLSPDIIELLKIYYYINLSDMDKINTYPYLIEDIFAKILLVREINNIKQKENIINLIFESKELDSFTYQLKNNQVIYKNYSLNYLQSKKENKLIDFSFTKDGDSVLNYLIRTNYKESSQDILKNDFIGINTEWLDESKAVLNNKQIKLKKGKNYKLNLMLDLVKNEKELLLKLIDSPAVNIDKSNILLNNQLQTFKFLNDNYLVLNNLNKGLNIITVSLKAEYSGYYEADGFIIINLNDYRYLIKQNNVKITVDK